MSPRPSWISVMASQMLSLPPPAVLSGRQLLSRSTGTEQVLPCSTIADHSDPAPLPPTYVRLLHYRTVLRALWHLLMPRWFTFTSSVKWWIESIKKDILKMSEELATDGDSSLSHCEHLFTKRKTWQVSKAILAIPDTEAKLLVSSLNSYGRIRCSQVLFDRLHTSDMLTRHSRLVRRGGGLPWMWSRVQRFWHFFRNSICFMCFWFGLELLKLVYKRAFFEILNGFYLIWPFILRKK